MKKIFPKICVIFTLSNFFSKICDIIVKNKFAYTANLLKIPIEKIVGKADSPLSLAREG